MRVVVSDSSVMIDLERGALLQVTFRLPHAFAVPDLLYHHEMKDYNGRELLAMGLQVMTLEADGVALAQAYRVRQPKVSLPDAFALALAKTGGHTLLSGDGDLRALAVREDVECRGLLWILDQTEEVGLLSPPDLALALSAIAAHPRCRLPRAEVEARLARYRQGR